MIQKHFAILTHMIAATVLLNANVALRAVLCVCWDIIGSLAVVGAFREPLFDGDAIGWSVIIVSTSEAERGLAHLARSLLSSQILRPDDHLAIRSGTKPKLGMRLHVVLECKLLVLVANIRTWHEIENEIFRDENITTGRHATDLRRDSLRNLNLEVHGPAVLKGEKLLFNEQLDNQYAYLAERVCTGKVVELIERLSLYTHRTQERHVGDFLSISRLDSGTN